MLCFQCALLHVSGNDVLAASSMRFQVWIGGQRYPAAPAEHENSEDNTHIQLSQPTVSSPVSQEPTTPEPSTTVAPPPQCANFTRIKESDSSFVRRTVLLEKESTFDECCSGVTRRTSK